jgi:hypothetical protein
MGVTPASDGVGTYFRRPELGPTMDDARIELVRGWTDRDIDGPADLPPEFTGAIEAGGEWVLVLDGQSVFGNPDRITSGGTAYTAPHDSLPLLFAMEAGGGETRGSYYTEEVGIRETHETLTEAGFTGYIELAENVVSGDYYVVYHGGESRSVAFLGDNGRLLTDEEAFDTAADEVGIYTVETATIDPTPLPTPDTSAGDSGADAGGSPGDEGGSAATAAATGAAAAASDAATPDPETDPGSETATEAAAPDPEPGTGSSTPSADADGAPAGHGSTEASESSGAAAGDGGHDDDAAHSPAGASADDHGGTADADQPPAESPTGGSAAADASAAGSGGPTPSKPGVGTGAEPAALSDTGDVAAVEQTVDQIADRVDRIDDQLDDVTETLEQLAERPANDEFAVPTDDGSAAAGSAEDGAQDDTRSRAPAILLLLILLLAGIAALDVATVVSVPGMDAVRDAIRSLAGLKSKLGARI